MSNVQTANGSIHLSYGSLQRRKPLQDRSADDKIQVRSKNNSATKTLVSIKPTRTTPLKFSNRMNSTKKQQISLTTTEFMSPRQLSSASSTRSLKSERGKMDNPSPRQMELRQFIQQQRDALKKESPSYQDTMNDDIIQMELDNDLEFGSSEEDGLSIESELSIEMNSVTETPYKGPSLNDDDISTGKGSPSTPSSQVSAFVQKQRVKSSENRTRAKRILLSPQKGKVNTPVQSNGSTRECPSPMNIKRIPSSDIENNGAFFVDLKSNETQEKEDSHDKVLKIILGNFAESRWLDFEDNNIIGQTSTLPFDLLLPEASKASSMNVDVEKVPHKKGFALTNESGESISSILLTRGESIRLNLSWTPAEVGGVREVIHLKLQRGRIRIIAHGHAKDAPKKKVRMKSNTTRGEGPLNVDTNASQKASHANTHPLTSSTSPKYHTATVLRSEKSEARINTTDLYSLETRYSSPKARKNLGAKFKKESAPPQRSWDNYNDEMAEKQCEAYTQWLNYMFQSPDHLYEVEQSQRQEAGIPDDIDRPTLRTLLVHRRRAQATLRAVQFYNGTIMLPMKRTIFNEIITDKISMRSDQDVLSNVMLRGQLLDLLMSYSTPWLRLGLEIIFGEVISNASGGNSLSPVKSNSTDSSTHSKKPSSIRGVLRQYIKDRVLSDPGLLLKYTGGKCKVPSGRFEKMYKIELRRHTLGIVLILVVFLDAAKSIDLIESSPLLFMKNGMIKSTKEFLDVLCRDYLHGIGNLQKHLSQIGIFVSHEQTHIDEIDFHVTNLATDLRDGVRLGKLAELLDKSVSVSENMRLPAGSRLQKVHNVKVSLAALRRLKIPYIDQIHPNYIVDSHRPQVLKMLWHIMHSFQLPNLVGIERLKNEIYAIQRTRKFASKIIKFSPVCGDIALCDDVCDLLLVWCQVVCSCYNVAVTNFSSDFADGRAVCFLIHHYHPEIMSKSDILPTKSSAKGKKSVSIIKNERQNFISANTKILDIGGIPNILAISDSENIPDERAMIINTAYLCSRLLESSTEIRAAKLIQKAFRRYCQAQLQEKQKAAVIIIEYYWTKQKDQYYRNRKAKFSDAVTSIERFFLAYRKKIVFMKTRRLAAIQIQKVVRRFIVQSQYLSIKFILNSSATVIQSSWRAWNALAQFKQILRATVVIQRFSRKTRMKRHDRLVSNSARSIQCAVRSWFAKRHVKHLRREKHFSELVSAVISCQANVRRNISQRNFLQMKSASIKIQSIARKYCASSYIRILNTSATKIQSIVRGYLASLQVLQKHRISKSTTDKFRAVIPQTKPMAPNRLLHESTHTTETNFSILDNVDEFTKFDRDFGEQEQYQQLNNLTESVIAPAGYLSERSSCAILIQKMWRGFVQFHQYQFDLSDIVFVQSLFRRRIHSTRFQNQRQGATKIQALWRGVQIRKKYTYCNLRMQMNSHFAATVIQKHWRGYIVSTDYAMILDASLTLQAFFRCQIQKKRIELAAFLNPITKENPERPIVLPAVPAEGMHKKLNSVDSITLSNCSYQRSVRSEVEAVTEIQRLIRGFLVRSDLEIQHFAATEVQRWWRGNCAQIDFLILLDATKRIQQWYRSLQRSQTNLPEVIASSASDYSVNAFPSRSNDQIFEAQYHSPIQLDPSARSEPRNHFPLLNLQNESRSPCSSEDRTRNLNTFDKMDQLIHIDNALDSPEPTAKFPIETSSKSMERHSQHSMVTTPLRDDSLKDTELALTDHSSNIQDKDALLSVPDSHSLASNRSNSIDGFHTKNNKLTLIGSKMPTLEDEIREAEQISMIQKARLEEKRRRSELLRRLRHSYQEESIEPKDSNFLGKSNGEAFHESFLRKRSCMVEDPSPTLLQHEVKSREESSTSSDSIQNVIEVYNHHNLSSGSFAPNCVHNASSTPEPNTYISSLLEKKIKYMETPQDSNESVDSRDFKSDHIELLDIGSTLDSGDSDSVASKSAQPNVQRPMKMLQIRKREIFFATVIQRYWRGFHCRDQYEATRWGIILLQSRIRGYRIRETYRRVAERSCKNSCASIEPKQSPHLALGSRTSAALSLLETSNELTEVMSAIKTLETSTRFSYVCCEAVVHKGSTNLLFRLIRYCNRSSPHVELLKYILKTLTNISKHTKLVDGVVCDRSVEILLDTIQMFRDKDKVLCLASTLLHMIVSIKNECLEECTKRENAKRLRGVFVLCKRKLLGNVGGSAHSSVLSNEQYIAQKSLGAILKKMKGSQNWQIHNKEL